LSGTVGRWSGSRRGFPDNGCGVLIRTTQPSCSCRMAEVSGLSWTAPLYAGGVWRFRCNINYIPIRHSADPFGILRIVWFIPVSHRTYSAKTPSEARRATNYRKYGFLWKTFDRGVSVDSGTVPSTISIVFKIPRGLGQSPNKNLMMSEANSDQGTWMCPKGRRRQGWQRAGVFLLVFGFLGQKS
jgi:hypothetical protein